MQVSAQGEISSIPFETIPGGTRFVVGAGEAIELQSNTAVTGDLTATGEVSTDVGIRFPDGTLQTTANTAGAGVTANSGLYSNTIPDFTPPLAYTEICVKNGDVSFDIHAAAEPTTGGNCSPGDIGWIIERFERDGGAGFTWTAARMECLKDGMRLPEPFEWQFTCDDSATFAVSDLEDDWEWASNSVEAARPDSGTPAKLAVLMMGNGSCGFGAHGNAARDDGQQVNSLQMRCVL